MNKNGITDKRPLSLKDAKMLEALNCDRVTPLNITFRSFFPFALPSELTSNDIIRVQGSQFKSLVRQKSIYNDCEFKFQQCHHSHV